MDRLDLRLVEYFVAVAEELHFGRAAERLHIAQPSLSQQIRRLESQVGVTLLERNTRSVKLTAGGEALLREGRRTLNQSRRALRAARAAGELAVTVGFYGSAGGDLLPAAIRTFNRSQPGAGVRIRELFLGSLDDLLHGEVDIAFTRLQPGQTELEVEVLREEPRFVALAVEHPLANRASLKFADLRDESFIVNPAVETDDIPERWLREQRRHGLPGRVAAKGASVQEVLTLVASGQGVALVPLAVTRRHPRPDLVYLPVVDAEHALVSLARPPGRPHEVVQGFIEAARRAARAADHEPEPAARNPT